MAQPLLEYRYLRPSALDLAERRLDLATSGGRVYARLDVLAAALDGELVDRGTTNVEVGEPLRRSSRGSRAPMFCTSASATKS